MAELKVKVEFNEEQFRSMIERFKSEHPDFVEVVRCKDCKYKDKWETNAYGYQWCGVSGLQVVEDISFCSYGERKDNERG